MADYNVTITFSIPITARNGEQAEERAEQLTQAVQLDPKFKKPWLGDMDAPETEVEEA